MGFTMGAFLVVAVSIYIAFVKNPDARSRFYGFTIARIGVFYGVAQLCRKTAALLAERNRLCKLNKN